MKSEAVVKSYNRFAANTEKKYFASRARTRQDLEDLRLEVPLFFDSLQLWFLEFCKISSEGQKPPPDLSRQSPKRVEVSHRKFLLGPEMKNTPSSCKFRR